MDFLDSLESNLKSLEAASEREEGPGARNKREADRAARIAIQPWVEKLRKSAFTDRLLKAAHLESFRLRARISAVWIGDILRLELRGKRLELRPNPNGVSAVSTLDGVPAESSAVDFESDPAAFLKGWLDKTAA